MLNNKYIEWVELNVVNWDMTTVKLQVKETSEKMTNDKKKITKLKKRKKKEKKER